MNIVNPQLGSGLGLGLGLGLGSGLGLGLGLDSVREFTISHKMKYLPQSRFKLLTMQILCSSRSWPGKTRKKTWDYIRS